MLVDLYVEALLVDSVSADQIWELWNARLISDELAALVQREGAKGLAWLALDQDGQVRSSFAKFLTEDETASIVARMGAEPGDLLLFVADQAEVVNRALSGLRLELGDRLGMRDPESVAG